MNHTKDSADELLGAVLGQLETANLSDDEDKRIRTQAVEAYKRVDEAESQDWYVSFVSSYIAEEFRKTQPDDDGDVRRDEPLCRCGSPTCWLKRGDLPPDIRDRSDGLMTTSTAQERTIQFLNAHDNPVVVREAHDEAQTQKRDGRAELIAAKSEAAAEAVAEVSEIG